MYNFTASQTSNENSWLLSLSRVGHSKQNNNNNKRQLSLNKKDPEKELSKIPWVILSQKLVWGKSHEILIFNRIL